MGEMHENKNHAGAVCDLHHLLDPSLCVHHQQPLHTMHQGSQNCIFLHTARVEELPPRHQQKQKKIGFSRLQGHKSLYLPLRITVRLELNFSVRKMLPEHEGEH